MRTVDWYFDVISPFSYLGLHRLDELPADVTVRYQPVLFAGLLGHWGSKGPAEIPPKRRWTYRWCTWLAAQQGLAFRFPAAHPFNPLPYLRLLVAAGATRETVTTVFEALWTTAADPADPAVQAAVAQALGCSEADGRAPEVKEALRAGTAAAAASGVFGVPTLVVDGELFWGADATPFASAFLAEPTVITAPEMARVDHLPVGVSRT